MSSDFNLEAEHAIFKIVGVGKCGISAVNHLIATTSRMGPAPGVEFLTVSTVASESLSSKAKTHIFLEEQSTSWIENPEKFLSEQESCASDRHAIAEDLKNAAMIIIIAGLGCGITTAGALFVAEITREFEIPTIGLVSYPFSFEGRSRVKMAEAGVKALKQRTDTTIVIQNDKLIDQALMGNQPVAEAYRRVDEALGIALTSAIGLAVWPGLICTDFDDIKLILCGGGLATFSWGEGHGENRAEHAVNMAINSPLLNGCELKKCKGLLIAIFCDTNVSIFEINLVCKLLEEGISEDIITIFGHIVVEELKNELEKDLLRVAIIATGIE